MGPPQGELAAGGGHVVAAPAAHEAGEAGAGEHRLKGEHPFFRRRPHGQALDDLAGVQVEALVTRPAGVATAVVRGVECAIPLEGVVDFAEELKRLDKVLAKADKDVGQLEKRLANPRFAEKAPANVVAEVRDKLEAAVARRATLQASRARIAEAIQ